MLDFLQGEGEAVMYKVTGFNTLSTNVPILLIVQTPSLNTLCDWASLVNA